MVDGHQPLTDSQWQVIAHLLAVQRKRHHCLRQVVDAMHNSCRTGCQWRYLPACFPPGLPCITTSAAGRRTAR
ncbi:transposase [Hymenobacter bucti]|uniref:Transposase n=1 Tax=Hymenobacter bucti TaxID=1844114 RepID=A0ABW4QZA1_9BACT